MFVTCSKRIRLVRLALLLGGLTFGGCAARVATRGVTPPPQPPRAPVPAAEAIATADRVCAERHPEAPSLAEAGADLEAALKHDGSDYPVLWRLSRLHFLLSEAVGGRDARAAEAKAGRMRAEQAIAANGARAEGYYYLAVNTGTLADVGSKLSLVKPTLRAAERAAAIDPRFDHAGPLVLMGKLYLQAPPWPLSIGNTEKAVELLERAWKLSPRPLTRMFLGQAYLEDDQPDKARQALEEALRATGDDQLEPKWRGEAERALARVKR